MISRSEVAAASVAERVFSRFEHQTSPAYTSYIEAYAQCMTPLVALNLYLTGKANERVLELFNPQSLESIQAMWKNRTGDKEKNMLAIIQEAQERLLGSDIAFPLALAKPDAREKLPEDSYMVLQALAKVQLNFTVANDLIRAVNVAHSYTTNGDMRQEPKVDNAFVVDASELLLRERYTAITTLNNARNYGLRDARDEGSLVHLYTAARSLAGILYFSGYEDIGWKVNQAIHERYGSAT